MPEISSALKHRRPGIRSHRTTTLTLGDITIRRGIRVTTVARTTADIAPRLTDTELVRLIHEARRNHDLPDAELDRLYAPAPAPPTSMTPRRRRAAASFSTSSKCS